MSVSHRPVDLAKGEFRFLEIQPARKLDDPIKCRMIHTQLRRKDRPEFIALSSLYSDDTPDVEKIYIGSWGVTIPKHISQGLRHIRAVFFPSISYNYQRKPKRRLKRAPTWLRQLFSSEDSVSRQSLYGSSGRQTLLVWLDLLCVDHNDDGEKAKQMLRMKEIFQEAELVVGWLGVKGEHTDMAMEAFAIIEDAMPPNFGDPGDGEKNPHDYSPTHQWAEQLKAIYAPGPAWLGVDDFLLRPYLHRVWILEELSMARYPIFLIGDCIIPWKQLLRFIRQGEEFRHNPSNVFPPEMISKMVDLPLEATHRLLDEFARKEMKEESRWVEENSYEKSTSTLSSR